MTKSFDQLLSRNGVSASTKRSPAISAGKRGAPAENLTGLTVLRLDPVDPDIGARLDPDRPHEVLQTFIKAGPDIKDGDVLVVATVDYPILAVEDWYWASVDAADTLRLIVKERKT
jgi:hypothetical protein